MLGCLFWVSPISVQHISLQPTRSNHTVQSIQNESTPGCYVRLSLLSLQPTRSNHTVQSIQNESTPGCYVRLSLLSLSHLRPTHSPSSRPDQTTPFNQSRMKVILGAMLGCIFWVSPISVQHISLQPTRSNHTIQSIQNESTPGWLLCLVAMLGCLFWVSPISVQHISLQPTRSNHTIQSIQNESTPGCYVRLYLLSLSHLRPTHLPPADQIKPHRSINPEWKYPWVLC